MNNILLKKVMIINTVLWQCMTIAKQNTVVSSSYMGWVTKKYGISVTQRDAKTRILHEKTQSQLTSLNLGRGRRINMPSEKLPNYRIWVIMNFKWHLIHWPSLFLNPSHNFPAYWPFTLCPHVSYDGKNSWIALRRKFKVSVKKKVIVSIFIRSML